MNADLELLLLGDTLAVPVVNKLVSVIGPSCARVLAANGPQVLASSKGTLGHVGCVGCVGCGGCGGGGPVVVVADRGPW